MGKNQKTISGLGISNSKVQTLWETHKNLSNIPHAFDIYFQILCVSQEVQTLSKKIRENIPSKSRIQWASKSAKRPSLAISIFLVVGVKTRYHHFFWRNFDCPRFGAQFGSHLDHDFCSKARVFVWFAQNALSSNQLIYHGTFDQHQFFQGSVHFILHFGNETHNLEYKQKK